MPNYQSQRQMIEHCFCVMDRIRNEFSREEYKKMVYNPEWAGTLFMTRAMECVTNKIRSTKRIRRSTRTNFSRIKK